MCYTPPPPIPCLIYYISNDHISITNLESCAMAVDLCFSLVVHPQKLSRIHHVEPSHPCATQDAVFINAFLISIDTTFEYHTLWGEGLRDSISHSSGA